MDHKIKPTATRIGVVNTWSTISYYNNLIEDIFISGIVKKMLLKFNILTSKIAIKKLPDYYIITYFCYFNSAITNRNRYRIISIIKGILEKYIQKRIYFQVVQVPSIINNAEILAEWIQLELMKTPKLHKAILKKVLKEYKRWSVY